MRRFIQWLKDERKRGTRGPGDGGEIQEPKMYVKDAYATTTTADGLGGSVEDPVEYQEIEQLRIDLGIYEPVTKLKRLKDIWTGQAAAEEAPDPQADFVVPPDGPPMTSKELVGELNGEARQRGVWALSACDIRAGHPRYGDAMNWFYAKVAERSYYAGDAKTPQRAQERLDAAEKVLAMVRERGELWW